MQKELIKTAYHVSGMTCESCVERVKNVLEDFEEIKTAEVQLNFPQVTISSRKPLDQELLDKALNQVGNYHVSLEDKSYIQTPFPEIKKIKPETNSPSFFETYKPLLLIVTFISVISFLTQYPFSEFSGMLWMRHFMSGFFLVFSFFKLLNLKGFAQSYRMYDIVASKWYFWGYLYPFVELALGISYLINFSPLATNIVTVLVLGVSSIGVIESNLNRRKIKCACLGDVFNLPMSTVTIVEDLTMVLMAVAMLFLNEF